MNAVALASVDVSDVNAPVFGVLLPIVPGASQVAFSRVDAFPAGNEDTVTHAVVFPAATDNTYPTDPRDGAVTIFDPPDRIGVNTGATFVLPNVSAELYAGATVFTGYSTPFPSAAGIAPIPPYVLERVVLAVPLIFLYGYG